MTVFPNVWVIAVLFLSALPRTGEPWHIKINRRVMVFLIVCLTEALFYALFLCPLPQLLGQILPYVIQALGLIFAAVLFRHLSHSAEYFLVERDIAVPSLFCNVLFLFFGALIYSRLMPDISLHYLLVVGFLGSYLLVQWVLFKQNESQRQKQQLEAYATYLPIVEELLEQLRLKQHDYHNELQSIRALCYCCEDHEELKSRLLSASEQELSDVQNQLLKINLHLLAGFLISKIHDANAQQKEFMVEIHNYVLQTGSSEYELIEYLGILVDNAIEATPPSGKIIASLDSKGGELLFQIKNPGPLLTPDFCRRIFQKGYTTKASDPPEHGLGLYKLDCFVRRYGRELALDNEEIDGVTYLVFQISL